MFVKQMEVGSFAIFAYIVACKETNEALVIDPAADCIAEDGGRVEGEEDGDPSQRDGPVGDQPDFFQAPEVRLSVMDALTASMRSCVAT